jgi:hypothetical protein
MRADAWAACSQTYSTKLGAASWVLLLLVVVDTSWPSAQRHRNGIQSQLGREADLRFDRLL